MRADQPTPPSSASTRAAWLLFAPPFAVLILRFWLNTLAESWPPAQPLTAVAVLGDGKLAPDDGVGALLWQASLPALLTLALVAVLALILFATVRAWGWPRVRPWALAFWLAACALAAAALALNHINRAALQPLPDVTATVVQARPQPSTERGPGGALTVLTLPDAPQTPRRVLLEGADWRALPPGAPLRLQRASGRFWGEYATGSNAPRAAPDQSAPPVAP